MCLLSKTAFQLAELNRNLNEIHEGGLGIADPPSAAGTHTGTGIAHSPAFEGHSVDRS